MIVGVPKEIKIREYRVGMVPRRVKALVDAGHKVLVETGAGVGSGIPDAEYARAGAQIISSRRRGVEARGDDRQGEGAHRARVRAHAGRADHLHLLPPRRRRSRADQGAPQEEGRRGRLRDHPARRRQPPPAPPDERGGRPHVDPGRRDVPGEGARRQGHPPRRRARRAPRARGHHRRRRGGHQRGEDRGRHGGGGHHPRHQPEPARLPRRRVPRPGGGALAPTARPSPARCARQTW